MQSKPAYSQLYIEKIRNELGQRLSPHRFAHSEKTAEIAVHYARSVGYDESKAELAGLMHDVAREFTKEQFDEAVKKYDIKLSRYNLSFPPSIHGRVGAVIAERELGIADEDILSAIRNHVSGRPCMKTLEEIIFLSDHIARGLESMPEAANGVLKEPLDEAMYHTLGYVIEFDAKHKKPIDERTMQTFDWIIEKIRNEAKTGPVDIGNDKLNALYGRMDELLELYAEHAITDFPAENMRDLGGYHTSDGRAVRNHKIFRSGNLDRFTPADFDRLASLGINYVVDLRSENEKMSKPETGNSGIHYIEVPFESTGECKSYLEILLDWVNECDDPEESAWLTAKYFDAFDIDDMYLKILLDPTSQLKFKEIAEIMLRDDCTGIHIFCQSGKDRTGMVISIIMALLGIDSHTALDDYMVSQVPYYALTMNYLTKLKKRDYNLSVQKQVIAVLGVESERPDRLNREILKRFNVYKQFFDADNIFTADEAERFKAKYLE